MAIIQIKLKEARKARKITQAEMGKLLGVTQQAYQLYEGKNPPDIQVSNLLKICEVLEVTPNWLLGVEEKAVVVKGASITHRNTEALKAVVKMDEKALAVKGALPKAEKPLRAVKAGKIVKGKA